MQDRGHHVLRVGRKGVAANSIALAPPTWRAIEAHLTERGHPVVGPLIGNKRDFGSGISRPTVQRVLNVLGERAGIATHLHPTRCGTPSLPSASTPGVPLHRVQDGAGHFDPATTQRYNRARHSLDHHATYRLADYLEAGEPGRLDTPLG
jgi:integrase/recombinase XerD